MTNYSTKLSVLYVAGMLLAMVLSFILFTLQSRKELTYLSAFVLGLFSTSGAGVILYFTTKDDSNWDESYSIWIIVAVGVCSILFGMLWVAIVRGFMFGDKTNSNSISPENFVLASMLLFIMVHRNIYAY